MDTIDVNNFFIDKFLKTISKKKKKEKKGSNKQNKKVNKVNDNITLVENDTITWDEIENTTTTATTQLDKVECGTIEIIL